MKQKMTATFFYLLAMWKFGCGVAPIRIETGSYENLQLENC